MTPTYIDIDAELESLGIDVYRMDERQSNNRQILLYGPTGVGKTHQALEIEEVLGPSSLFYVNFEKGQLTIEGSEIKGANIRDIDTLSKAMFTMQQACLSGRNKYKAIMIDSASDLYDAALRKYTKENALLHPGKDPLVSAQPDYLKTLNKINDMLLFIKELPMHVIFTAQDTVSKDSNNIERTTPALSPSITTSFFKYADAILYMYINSKGERCALTKPKGRIHAKFRTRAKAVPPPPEIVDPNVGDMFKYWDGEDVEFKAAA